LQKIFKVLASIAAWVLFLLALVGLVWTFVAGWDEATFEVIAWFSLWVVTLVLSVVVMKLRKTLD
jgi:putative copper export protein